MKDKNRIELLKELMEDIDYPRANPDNSYLTKDELTALAAWVKSMKERDKHGSDKGV
ncbi:MAG: hypothetical protein GTN39_03130 [Candidatus Aenigmarchaeota archaeon]|nr:hypothetical protein [Candidatus Aenigmarchaeota archaeon]